MLNTIYRYGRLLPCQERWQANYLIRTLHERFTEKLVYLNCRDIREMESEQGVPPEEDCNRAFVEGAKMIVELILESADLLDQVTDEEKEKDRF